MGRMVATEQKRNNCNSYGAKTVLTEIGRLELAISRDRQASFDLQLIAKYSGVFPASTRTSG